MWVVHSLSNFSVRLLSLISITNVFCDQFDFVRRFFHCVEHFDKVIRVIPGFPYSVGYGHQNARVKVKMTLLLLLSKSSRQVFAESFQLLLCVLDGWVQRLAGLLPVTFRGLFLKNSSSTFRSSGLPVDWIVSFPMCKIFICCSISVVRLMQKEIRLVFKSFSCWFKWVFLENCTAATFTRVNVFLKKKPSSVSVWLIGFSLSARRDSALWRLIGVLLSSFTRSQWVEGLSVNFFWCLFFSACLIFTVL